MNVRLVHSNESQPSPLDKERMIDTLRGLLQDTCRLRNEGTAYAKLTYAQGLADGYMRVLTNSGYLTSHELLDIIRDVRRGVDGPATRTLSAESVAVSA
jgi:hypothetical protein